MSDFQKQQAALDALANLALANADTPLPWLPEDLVNVTIILNSVAMSLAWIKQDGLSINQKCALATEYGKNIYQTLKLFTGCDLHELVKNP